MVKRWYADFRCSHTDTNDAEYSGCPNSPVILVKTKKLHKLVLVNCKLKLHEIAEDLKISLGSVFTILHKHLSLRKLCSSWVPICSQSIKNNASTTQSVVCNCFNTMKRSFCINMWQWMKDGSTISLQSQISSQRSEQQLVKAIQNDQRCKHL